MADRPGFLVYFDITPALYRLSDVEAGQLFKALLHYAQSGDVPALDGLAGFAFDLLRPRLDRDRQAYRERCERNRYVAYSREAKRRGEEPADFEAWKLLEAGDLASRDVTERDQLNRTELEPNSTPAATGSSTTTAARKGGAGGEAVIASVDHTVTEGEFVAMREAAMRKLASYTPYMKGETT